MTLRVINPANGELLRELASDDPVTIADKVARARRAQAAWRRTPQDARLACVRKLKELVVARTAELALTLTDEVGKPIKQSLNELKGTLPRFDFFAEHTARAVGDEIVLDDDGMTERIELEPLGVVANISAWNYPWFVGLNVILPALATGNAVVYKPSELSTLTGLAIDELVHAAGVPADVFQVVVGDGAAGAALLEQALDGVFFTGSFATGQKIALAAARQLAHVGLELGGKDPTYVCEDVDVAGAAASLADGAFYNTGQSCCSVERIYVHERIHDAFVEAFVAEVKGFVMGDPRDEATYIGPLTRRDAQIEVLAAQVADATTKGARVLTGGKRADRPGWFFEPTTLVGVDHSMAVMKDESFGPIIGIQRVSGDAQAVELMRDTEYGLTAGVYTPDLPRAERILSGVESGSAYVNCCDRVSPRLPWSGRRHSGVGCTLSEHGIRAFTRPRGWHVRRA